MQLPVKAKKERQKMAETIEGRKAGREKFISDLKTAREKNGEATYTASQIQNQTELYDLETANLEDNLTRSGVGTRLRAGQTRGKSPIVIKWEAFDEGQPETLPKDIKAFMAATKVTSEDKLTEFLITGFNDANYTAASDELAEFVNKAWDDALQSQFRLVVRNYYKALKGTKSIEDIVAMFKPGMEAAFLASQVPT